MLYWLNFLLEKKIKNYICIFVVYLKGLNCFIVILNVIFIFKFLS